METKRVHVTIDRKSYDIPENATILDACKGVGIKIPTLCYLEGVSQTASCGVCVVETKAGKPLQRACVTKVMEGMDILTTSKRVLDARKTNVELLLANHPADCLSCLRNGNCELQRISEALGVSKDRFEPTRKKPYELDVSSLGLVRDPNKCILCQRCVSVCEAVQTVRAIDVMGRGSKTRFATFKDAGLASSTCTGCGQCALVCPTAAIVERDDTDRVWALLQDPERHVVVQTAPAIRVGLGEAMGMDSGSLVTGQMVAGLRRLGFAKVFDTQFTADLTIMEEGHELIHRLTTGGTLPLITSCSPGWIKFIEHFYPDLLGHVSTCKSPQQMFGAVAKTYYAKKAGVDPEKMSVVSIMPCTAKKFEAARPEMTGASAYWKLGKKTAFADVDVALTTRELGRMIKEGGIDFVNLADDEYDAPMGQYTGAGTIFGATGGVMEAALRTVYAVVTGENLPNLNITAVRGLEGVKEATVKVGALGDVKVAIAHGLGNARKLMEKIREGKADYHFIEVMACPGGCIAGGGEPIPTNNEVRKLRSGALYKDDESVQRLRQSHENPAITEIYDTFLKEPLGHTSHELLHTHYVKRGSNYPQGK